MTNVLPIREGNLLWNGVIFAKDLLYDMTNTELFRPIKEQSLTNGPFPSSLVPLFQSESKCKTMLMKMTVVCLKMNLLAELIFI